MRILKGIIFAIITLSLAWATISYIEIVCKNLTTASYSDWNLIVMLLEK